MGNSFIISFDSLSINSKDEVKKIEFDLVIYDYDEFEEIDRVSGISLEL